MVTLHYRLKLDDLKRYIQLARKWDYYFYKQALGQLYLMLSSLKKESAGNDLDQPHLSTADITEYGRWTWSTNKPPTGSEYGWTSSPFWESCPIQSMSSS